MPEGWCVVTAGNPPEYNNSVREFDIVTWDRLKRIDVEPDYKVWKEYAYKKGIHPAILTYLDIKTASFYRIETTVDGKSFVTARGWSDLSDMIQLYEEHDLAVDELLVAQYLQNKRIAKEFAIYYDLFNKYRSDYQVDKILLGEVSVEIQNRAKAAKFDERLALMGLLLDAITEKLRAVNLTEQMLTELLNSLKAVRLELNRPTTDGASAVQKQINDINKRIQAGKMSSTLSKDGEYACRCAVSVLEKMATMLKETVHVSGMEAFQLLKTAYDKQIQALRDQAGDTGENLSNIFRFCEDTFGEGQETLILVTELTISYYGAHFISRYGCPEYFAHNKELLFYERQKEIIEEIENLNLDE